MQHSKDLHTVYLGLGSNLGDKSNNLRRAIQEIEKRIGKVIAYSAFYITEAVGFASIHSFLNAACKVSTNLSPIEVLREGQCIEKELGRTNKSKNEIYTDRIIDIDILLFDKLILQLPQLIIPHPHLHKRLFVLTPLASIAADEIHPLLHKTIEGLKLDYEI